jgi:hypothetical protein
MGENPFESDSNLNAGVGSDNKAVTMPGSARLTVSAKTSSGASLVMSAGTGLGAKKDSGIHSSSGASGLVSTSKLHLPISDDKNVCSLTTRQRCFLQITGVRFSKQPVLGEYRLLVRDDDSIRLYKVIGTAGDLSSI